ncbi:hypothetical protein BDN72DRAFT_850973 [Pluteus cervinus]|uniref:Uncharacterized protein n=1 Tax=Pluteus cervinus TaxID=181527 RepID=A0ACD3A2L2_9AGAR|nr:hypothetical protein BDN72DRAFT_850973 [Pluteus cervinus]
MVLVRISSAWRFARRPAWTSLGVLAKFRGSEAPWVSWSRTASFILQLSSNEIPDMATIARIDDSLLGLNFVFEGRGSAPMVVGHPRSTCIDV